MFYSYHMNIRNPLFTDPQDPQDSQLSSAQPLCLDKLSCAVLSVDFITASSGLVEFLLILTIWTFLSFKVYIYIKSCVYRIFHILEYSGQPCLLILYFLFHERFYGEYACGFSKTSHFLLDLNLITCNC